MATVTFAGLGGPFDITGNLLSYNSGNLIGVDPASWIYDSGFNDWVVFLSDPSDLIFDGSNVPVSGTVTSFEFWPEQSTAQLTITDLSLDFAELAPITGSLSDEQENNLVWRLLLAGDDTIDLGSSGFDISFAGDGSDVEDGQSLFGGSDSITGSAGAGIVNGDYSEVLSGAMAFGANDAIDATAYVIDGDAYRVYAGGFLQGGNDTLGMSAPQASGYSFLIGDVDYVDGTVIGGNDTINASNATDAYGDAFEVNGILVGGDNSITGGAAAEILVGNSYVVTATSSAQGGNDIIRGGDEDDFIYGDFFSVRCASTTSRVPM